MCPPRISFSIFRKVFKKFSSRERSNSFSHLAISLDLYFGFFTRMDLTYALLKNHHEHERRLAELATKTFLSTDEEVEEKRL